MENQNSESKFFLAQNECAQHFQSESYLFLKHVKTKSVTRDVRIENHSGRRYCESRHRLRRFCFNLFIFLLPLAVEVASSAVSAELHQIRHIRHRHNQERHRDQILRHGKDISRHSVNFSHFLHDDLRYSDEFLHHSVGILQSHSDNILRHRRFSVPDTSQNASLWPAKRVAEIYGDIVIGGLHMIHEREDAIICGPVMPQGGLQALMNCSRNLKYEHQQVFFNTFCVLKYTNGIPHLSPEFKNKHI
jgi:hypothetical protein